jgi:FAD:protein FMN transferase
MNLAKLFILSLFLITGCSDNKTNQYKDYIFGTIIDIKIYKEDPIKSDKVTNLIFNDFHRLHKYLHAWQPSEISNINNAIKENRWYQIDDPEIIKILEDNKVLSKQTNGLFNPAIGELINLWGFHSDLPANNLPNTSLILDYLKNPPSMNDLIIENKMLRSKNTRLQIDLGGYAKGYALARAKKILLDNNIQHALINIGGNILALGKPGDRFWKVGIQHPRKAGAIASVELKPGWSIGTSGDYQRYFSFNNKRYSHLIDPDSGYPADNAQSATVLIPPIQNSEIKSDVYSKPLFIAQKTAKHELAMKLDIEYYLIILNDGSLQISKKMSEMIEWIEMPDEKNLHIQ